MTKIFISYSTADREMTKRLHDDLRDRGATVYQFEESAKPGSDAWGQVLSAIDDSDFFLVLLTQESVNSNAVNEEINHANHRYINRRTPILIPAMVEPVEKPLPLVRFTDLPFSAYDEGFGRLLNLIFPNVPSKAGEDMSGSGTEGEGGLGKYPLPTSGIEKGGLGLSYAESADLEVHDVRTDGEENSNDRTDVPIKPYDSLLKIKEPDIRRRSVQAKSNDNAESYANSMKFGLKTALPRWFAISVVVFLLSVFSGFRYAIAQSMPDTERFRLMPTINVTINIEVRTP